CEAPLENRGREADGTSALVGERVSTVELLPNIVGDVFVEPRFRLGEFVGHRVRNPRGKERSAVELEKALLHHPSHQVGHLDLMNAVAESALETIAIEQSEEELEVLLLAVVRRCRHQEEVSG